MKDREIKNKLRKEVDAIVPKTLQELNNESKNTNVMFIKERKPKTWISVVSSIAAGLAICFMVGFPLVVQANEDIKNSSLANPPAVEEVEDNNDNQK